MPTYSTTSVWLTRGWTAYTPLCQLYAWPSSSGAYFHSAGVRTACTVKVSERAIIRPDWVKTWRHYVFQQRQQQKAELVRGYTVIIFDESYTPVTCGAYGNIHEKLDGKKSFKYPNQLLVCCGPGCGQRDKCVNHSMGGSSSPLPNTTHSINILSSLGGACRHPRHRPERPTGDTAGPVARWF